MRSRPATVLTLLSAILTSPVVLADVPSPQQVVRHHIVALQKGDVEQLVADYAPDAVIVLSIGSFTGLTQIKKMFKDYLASDNDTHKAWEATAEPGRNGMVIEHWSFYRGKPQESSGTDILVVRDGKIVFHTMGPDAACKK